MQSVYGGTVVGCNSFVCTDVLRAILGRRPGHPNQYTAYFTMQCAACYPLLNKQTLQNKSQIKVAPRIRDA